MKQKRTIILGVMFILVLTLLAGCTGKKEGADILAENPAEKKGSETAMGRYREESLDMPDEVIAGTEMAIKLLKNPKGQLEVYSMEFDGTTFGAMHKYIGADGEWKKETPKWLNDKVQFTNYSYDDMGVLYGLGMDTDTGTPHFVSTEDGVITNPITVEGLEPDDENGSMPVAIEGLSDHRIALSFYDNLIIYEDGKEYMNVESGSYQIARMGNQIMVINRQGDGVIIYDIESKKKVAEVPVSTLEGGATLASDGKENWYLCDSRGLHRLSKDGNMWETIIDGAYNSLSAPKYNIETILNGEKDDFYVLLSHGEGNREIKHYIYDATLETVPGKSISIVSLTENQKLRQATVDFQNENPNIRVDYTILLNEEGINPNDAIKQLNTELLSGKGPDIIVMDGMPIDSYVEKGVLMELDEILNPLVKEGSLYPNIAKAGEINGKVYAMPVSMGLPVIVGKKEAVEASGSLAELAKYAENKAEVPLLGRETYTYEELIILLNRWYSDEYKDAQGNINQELLTAFLERANIIADQTQAVDKAEGSFEERWDPQYNMIGSEWLFEDFAECFITEYKSLVDIFIPTTLMEQTDCVFASMGQKYVPYGMLGINNASGNKEEAKKLLKIVWSESIQKLELRDGYPVNPAGTGYWNNSNDDFLISTPRYESTRPSKDKIEEVTALCGTVNKASIVDTELEKMIASEAVPVLSGRKTAEEAASAIISKANTYLSE